MQQGVNAQYMQTIELLAVLLGMPCTRACIRQSCRVQTQHRDVAGRQAKQCPRVSLSC